MDRLTHLEQQKSFSPSASLERLESDVHAKINQLMYDVERVQNDLKTNRSNTIQELKRVIDHGQQLESEIEAISQSKPQSDGVADKNLMKRISKLENMIKNKE